MATTVSKVPVSMWTEKQVEIANRVIKISKEYSGSFIERFGKAAQDLGYDNYGDLPQGVKSYISHLGGKRKKK